MNAESIWRTPALGLSREAIGRALVLGLVVVCLNTGLLDWLGVPPSLSGLGVLGFAGALAFVGGQGRSLREIKHGFILVAPLLLVVLAGLIRGQFNHSSILELGLFSREMLAPAVLFLAFWWAPRKSISGPWLTVLLVTLAVLQVLVCAIKFGIVGVNEKDWIGTMTQSAGQLGLLMPSLALGFVWAFGVVHGRLAMAGFAALLISLVGVVSEKRAMMFLAGLVPVLVFVLWCFLTPGLPGAAGRAKQRGLGFLVATLVTGGAVVFASLGLIQSLRGEGPRFERYGTHGPIEYMQEYLTRDYDSPMNISKTGVEENPNIQLGRSLLLKRAIFDSFSQSPVDLVFGHGGGWLLEHRLLKDKGRDVLYDRTGLRGPAGLFVRHIYELGWLGTTLVVLWVASLAYLITRRLRLGALPVLEMGALTGLAVMMFDYVFYSEMAWNSGVFMPILLLLVVSALRARSECRSVS